MKKRRAECGKKEHAEAVCERIRAIEAYKSAESVMIYMPIKGEVDVTLLLADKKTFLLPVTEGKEMYAAKFTGALSRGEYGISVPEGAKRFDGKIDAVIAPGVAFGRDFNRVGFGGGYYDKFLREAESLKIGVCHAFQLVEEIDAEEHDVKMDIIVTEEETPWSRENI